MGTDSSPTINLLECMKNHLSEYFILLMCLKRISQIEGICPRSIKRALYNIVFVQLLYLYYKFIMFTWDILTIGTNNYHLPLCVITFIYQQFLNYSLYTKSKACTLPFQVSDGVFLPIGDLFMLSPEPMAFLSSDRSSFCLIFSSCSR